MSRHDETNVAFANALIETEIAQRNARKDAQENTARGVIVTAGLVLTLLLGLANDAGGPGISVATGGAGHPRGQAGGVQVAGSRKRGWLV